MTKAVIVTGASSGIGLCTARYLAERDFTVFTCVRKPEDAEKLTSYHPHIKPVVFDVRDRESIAKEFHRIKIENSALTAISLVNNAGICITGPLEYISLDELRLQFEVNIFGVIAVAQSYLQTFIGDRRIINVGSAAGRIALPFLGPYAASKHALKAFNESLRRELMGQGIPVTLIELGSVMTPIWTKLRHQAEQSIGAFGIKAKEKYQHLYENLITTNEKEAQKRTTKQQQVARVIYRALTADVPKTNYVVGSDAKLNVLVTKFLPDRWIDAFLRRSMEKEVKS